MKKTTYFRKNLLKWYADHHRPMPWKEEKDPYLIWLSEIILQQTRVEQGLPYFLKFKKHYPTITDLANAPEDELMKHWQGLGYYSRARNLHKTAKKVAFEYDGIFPNTYAEILKLSGVGPYTAAAISSFAFNLKHAVVDGNVYRVLSRFFGIGTPIDSTPGKKEFEALANSIIPADFPGQYNQAIMDFGASHCSPKLPKCSACNMASHCAAFQNKMVASLPVKSKKLKKRSRYFLFLVFKDALEQTLLQKRVAKDVWQDLYQFPMIEVDDLNNLQSMDVVPPWLKAIGFKKTKVRSISGISKQTLSHQYIFAQFVELKVDKLPDLSKEAIFPTAFDGLNDFAFPRIIAKFLEEEQLSLF